MDEFDVCKIIFISIIFFLIIFFNLVNIGQNNPGNNNTPTPQFAPPQISGTNPTQQSTAIPTANNIPGVVAGNLDFSNIARSIGSMVQGITGRFIPGATLVNPNQTMPNSTASSSTTITSNTTSSTQNSNTTTGTTSNNNETDAVTGQMLGGRIIFGDKRVCSSLMLFYRTFTFIGRWS
jgi:hypothetical protein